MTKNGKLVKNVQTKIPLAQNLQVPCGSETHILMYEYDITINDWHQSLNYVIKKVYTYDNDRTNYNDACTANVIRELCQDRDTQHYPVIIDSCSESNDFLKALCTL